MNLRDLFGRRSQRALASVYRQEIGMDSKLVVVRRFPALIHAELAKSALEASEIDAAIHHGGSSQQRLRPELGTEIALMVREEDAEAALEILGPPDERFSE